MAAGRAADIAVESVHSPVATHSTPLSSSSSSSSASAINQFRGLLPTVRFFVRPKDRPSDRPTDRPGHLPARPCPVSPLRRHGAGHSHPRSVSDDSTRRPQLISDALAGKRTDGRTRSSPRLAPRNKLPVVGASSVNMLLGAAERPLCEAINIVKAVSSHCHQALSVPPLLVVQLARTSLRPLARPQQVP